MIGKDALQQVPTLLKNIRKVLIVSDGNTRPLAFEKVTSALETAGISWCEAYFDQTNVVIPNEASVSFILGNTASDVEALVGIGSGVISDLCKYTSHKLGLPYMIIATAPSMDGYASAGAAMAYVRNSRPASGSEQHLSHYFEITGIIHNRSYLDHGIDVAYSAILTAQLRSLLATADPSAFAWNARGNEWEEDIDRIYASLAPEVKRLQNEAGFYDTNRIQLIRQKWPEIKAVLMEAPSRSEMEQLLECAGYHVLKFVDFYTADVIRTGIEYAKDLKNRYTLLNLFQDVGLIRRFSSQMQLLADRN